MTEGPREYFDEAPNGAARREGHVWAADAVLRPSGQQAIEIAMAFDGIRQPIEHLLAARRVVDFERLRQSRPAQQRFAGRRLLEDAVQVRGHDLTVRRDGAVWRAVIEQHGGVVQRGPAGPARVDLV